MGRLSVVVLIALLTMFSAACLFAAEDPTSAQGLPGETKEQRDARMQWWREARFGMFIHWGVYSVPAGTYNGKKIEGIGEWIMNYGSIPVAEYAKYAAQFNPQKFNADEWVSMAKDAGMKYIVITSKHHDGFAMFHSKVSPFNIYDATPFKRDPLAELAEACKKQGIKLGFYYSQCQDWHHPGGAAYLRKPRTTEHWDTAQDGSFDEYVKTIALPQVREILTNYGPVAVLWFDTPRDVMTHEIATPFVDLLRELQPTIVWNNRLGGGYAGDTETPEQFIPATGFPGRDWETCMTMNDTWGYKSYDDKWKSTETLIRNLCDIASKGGNYLLNVGPTSEGLFPQPSIDRLKEIGAWMKVNGDAIYGTSASPFKRYSFNGRCTVKGDKLYVHVFNWRTDGAGVKIEGLKTPVKSARFMNGDAATIESGSSSVTIKPPASPDPIATVVELQLEGKPEVDPAVFAIAPAPDGSLHLTAVDALIEGRRVKLENEDTNDGPNIGHWTSARDSLEWDVMVKDAGEYAVEMNYACQDSAAGSKVELQFGPAGDPKVAADIAGTGTWQTYKKTEFGKVTLPAGAQSVKLKPTTMPHGTVMNLREVRLTPAK